MSMIKQSIEVSKSNKDTKKREKIGEVAILIPALDEFGITAESEADKETGLPLYKDDKLAWLFGCVVAATKADARNKLMPASTTLRDGAKIAETLAELMESGAGGGNPEAIKAITELKKEFASWVDGLGKSAKACNLLKSFFNSKQALALQSAENRQKFAGYVTEFAASLPEISAVKARYLASLGEIADAEEEEADDF